MSKTINSVVSIKLLINAISTIIMHRHTIVVTFPVLLKLSQEGGNLVSIITWGGICVATFALKVITYKNRFKPSELVNNLKKTSHEKVVLEGKAAKYLNALRSMQSDSLIFEYVVSNGLVGFFLNYLSLMKLVKQSAQIVLTDSIIAWRNVLSNRLLPCLIAGLSSIAVCSSSYIELEEKKGYQELASYLKNNTTTRGIITNKKKVINVWFESTISQYICYSLPILLLLLTPNSKFLFNATLLSTYTQLAVGLAVMQGLKRLITFTQTSYAKIYSTYVTLIAVMTAGSSMQLIMKQDHTKLLSPLAKKIGLGELNGLMYSLESACYTVFLWAYGISLYRVDLHNSYVKSIALEVKSKVCPPDAKGSTVIHSRKTYGMK